MVTCGIGPKLGRRSSSYATASWRSYTCMSWTKWVNTAGLSPASCANIIMRAAYCAVFQNIAVITSIDLWYSVIYSSSPFTDKFIWNAHSCSGFTLFVRGSNIEQRIRLEDLSFFNDQRMKSIWFLNPYHTIISPTPSISGSSSSSEKIISHVRRGISPTIGSLLTNTGRFTISP